MTDQVGGVGRCVVGPTLVLKIGVSKCPLTVLSSVYLPPTNPRVVNVGVPSGSTFLSPRWSLPKDLLLFGRDLCSSYSLDVLRTGV